MGQTRVEIVKRSELHRFVVLPKGWLVERTIAWLNHCPRLAKNWENRSYNARAFLRLAQSVSCSENDAIPHELTAQTLRVRLRNHRCAIRRRKRLPMATWIMASETSRRFS